MKDNEEAVSPVIGVILMVAITVILAAVIAAFVFGLAGSQTASKTVGLNVQANGTQGFTILITGGADVPTLNQLNYTVNGVTGASLAAGPYTVGQQLINSSAFELNGKRMIITGTFKDGSTVVLFDKQF